MASEIISMDYVVAAFSKNAVELALKISKNFNARVFAPERFINFYEGVEPINAPLTEWAGKFFNDTKALIFVSACGIATRAIAPHIKSKLKDPAVIVIDELGKFVIPILSGHVGGANELSRKIASFIHAVPVITTATDINNLTAVDEWAVKNNCVIENPSSIKKISSEILEGYRVGVAVTDELQPAPFPVTLFLRPRNLILGAGCNRGIDFEEFENAAKNFLESSGVSILSLKALASIDIKSNEPALINFAKKYNIPFVTFTAEELKKLSGNFTSSQKVLKFTGVDNICERACILAAGAEAVLMRNKFIYENKITFALARVNVI